MGLMILLFFILKRFKRNNLAQFLLYTSFPVAYLLPILKAVYRYNKTSEDHDKDPMKIWFQIELYYFFFFIISISAFMIFAYFKKYKSMTKSTSDILVEKTQKDQKYEGSDLYERVQKDDLWNNKKSDDFLRYLKFEAFNFGYLLTALCFNSYINA